MKRSARQNLVDPEVVRSFGSVPFAGLSTAIRTRMAYRFERAATPTLPWARCVERGHAACADVACLVGALLVYHRRERDARLLFETRTDEPLYAHVRVVIDSHIIDAWPETSFREPTGRHHRPLLALFSRTADP